MQKRISSFFGDAPDAKRTKASAAAAEQSAADVLAEPKVVHDDDVSKRIAASRAAALAKLAARHVSATNPGGPAPFSASALEPSWRRALNVTLSEKCMSQSLCASLLFLIKY
jgi:hypothetical protein